MSEKKIAQDDDAAVNRVEGTLEWINQCVRVLSGLAESAGSSGNIAAAEAFSTLATSTKRASTSIVETASALDITRGENAALRRAVAVLKHRLAEAGEKKRTDGTRSLDVVTALREKQDRIHVLERQNKELGELARLRTEEVAKANRAMKGHLDKGALCDKLTAEMTRLHARVLELDTRAHNLEKLLAEERAKKAPSEPERYRAGVRTAIEKIVAGHPTWMTPEIAMDLSLCMADTLYGEEGK